MLFKKTFHPEIFQGHLKKKNYFEGWYFKIVSKVNGFSIAFIPGVSLNKVDPHAFIQVFLSKKDELITHYFRFDIADFTYEQNEFKITIKNNFFSYDQVHVELINTDVSFQGDFSLSHHTKIRQSILSPNIMGFFGYLHFMECYHGILSMDSKVTGSIQINKTTYNIDQEKAYIEKDWGKSFPKGYVWLQSNHFKNKNTSFMFSYAYIPFVFFTFKGLIINLIHEGIEYRFATYNNSKVKKMVIENNKVLFIIKKGSLTLEVSATKSDDIELVSPSMGMMIHTIKEGLSGEITVKLYKKNQLVFEDLGTDAGIEIMMKQA